MDRLTSMSVRSRRSLVLLASGAIAGIVIAVSGLVSRPLSPDGPLPLGVVARVNEAVISQEEYQRTLEGLASDKRNPLTDADRRHALERLIDEELLLQRGLEIGLATSDPAVRKAISSAMIAQIVAENAAEQPTEAELEHFYEKERDFFAGPGRVRARQITISSAPDRDEISAEQLAQDAYRALKSGTPFEQVRQRYAGTDVLELPDVLLPPAKLADYLGPTLARIAVELEPGVPAPPMKVGSSFRILLVVERQSGEGPALNAIRTQVEAEYRRRRSTQALLDYLAWLRGRADLRMAPGRVE